MKDFSLELRLLCAATKQSAVLTQDIRDGQMITFIVGSCGQGDDKRDVQTAFALEPGDTLVVFRPR